MTLPFNNKSRQRKFNCFVCGTELPSLEDFKEHVVKEHEELKDYIICPVPHCKTPVRDLKMHVKCNHPGLDTKRLKGPLRAIVWRDFKNGKTKKKVNFKKGVHESTKMKKGFIFRSGMEESVFKALDDHKDILAYEVEPFVIEYFFEGANHKYTPDVFVTFQDGKEEIWEIKPENQTEMAINKAKWEAARQAGKMRGWEFKVITEKSVKNLINEAKK